MIKMINNNNTYIIILLLCRYVDRCSILYIILRIGLELWSDWFVFGKRTPSKNIKDHRSLDSARNLLEIFIIYPLYPCSLYKVNIIHAVVYVYLRVSLPQQEVYYMSTKCFPYNSEVTAEKGHYNNNKNNVF